MDLHQLSSKLDDLVEFGEVPIDIHKHMDLHHSGMGWYRVWNSRSPEIRSLFKEAAVQNHPTNRRLLRSIHPWDLRDLGIKHLLK